MMNAEHSFRCFAKINLCLKVGPLRGDGFHEISTVFQTIELHDTLKISPASKFLFTYSNSNLPDDDQNLVVRAAHLFFKSSGLHSDFHIHLDKYIPIAAGLGGGSSDAAATLRALNLITGKPLRAEKLHELALVLGSDVPFFLIGGRAQGRGRGEILEQLPDLAEMHLVLVVPNFGVSAADAYRDFDLTFDAQFRDTTLSRQCAGVSSWEQTDWHNDLERGVFAKYPKLRQIKETLLEQGASNAVMCGSGSAVVALFSGEEAAKNTTQAFKSGEQNVLLTKSLSLKQFNKRFVSSVMS